MKRFKISSRRSRVVSSPSNNLNPYEIPITNSTERESKTILANRSRDSKFQQRQAFELASLSVSVTNFLFSSTINLPFYQLESTACTSSSWQRNSTMPSIYAIGRLSKKSLHKPGPPRGPHRSARDEGYYLGLAMDAQLTRAIQDVQVCGHTAATSESTQRLMVAQTLAGPHLTIGQIHRGP